MKGLTDIDEGTIRRIDWQELMPGTMLLRAFSMAFRLFPVIMFSILLSLWISGSGGCPVDTDIRSMFCADSVCFRACDSRKSDVSNLPKFYAESKINAISVKVMVNEKASETSDISDSDNFSKNVEGTKGKVLIGSNFWKIPISLFHSFHRPLYRGEQVCFSCREHIALVLALFVFSIFWAMNARSSAVRLASSERSGFFDSLKYTFETYKTIVGLCFVYLLFTFTPALVAWGLHGLSGVCGQGISAVILPIKLFFVFCFGLTFVFFTAAFPLMISAIAVEKCDAFEAFSRGLSYVLARPLHYFFYLLIAGIFALIGFFLFQLTVQCSLAFLKSFVPSFLENTGSEWSLFWIRSMLLLPFGFLLTFFITAETTIYLILRRSVDGTPVATWHSDSSHKPSRKLAPLLDEAPSANASDKGSDDSSNVSDGSSASNGSEVSDGSESFASEKTRSFGDGNN